ncbi:MAG: hypothetical protein DRP89_08735, partial [Candidatus Neomarinimicrobiota bacterium]
GMDYRMDAFINQGSYYNGWADGNNIGFGSQNGQYWARSSDVVYHEYTHNTVYHLYGNDWIGDPNNWYTQGSAMDEGFADFFACTINNDHIQGESVGVSRDLDNTLEWDPSENKYYDCRVIGGACWDLREAPDIGVNYANELVFDALQMTPHAYNFADFLDNMILADDDDGNIDNGTPHDDQICDAFINNHKIVGTYLVGKINRNITIDQSVIIIGSVTVTSGATLTIQPGVTVEFGGYYNLTAKADSKIIAEGTEDEPILFTSATGTSRQSWKNIYIYSSHNRFKWCTFEYGNWALKVEGYPNFATDNVIENCTFHDNDQALRIHKNTATVKNCQIYNNRHGLVCCNNTQVDFTANHIYNNDRDGVYTWSGNHLNFLRNVIENNGLGHSSTCNGNLYNFFGCYLT